MIYSFISHELLLTSEIQPSLLYVPANSVTGVRYFLCYLSIEVPSKKQHSAATRRAVQMSKGGTPCPTEPVILTSDKAQQVDPAGNFKQGNTHFGVISGSLNIKI